MGTHSAGRSLPWRLTGATVALAALLVAVGCKHESPSTAESPDATAVVRLGAAHPSGHTTTVTQPTGCADKCAYTDPSLWPKACDLLNEDEIRAVLPDTTTIEMTPADQTVSTKGKYGLGGEGLGTAKGSICKIGVRQPSGYPNVKLTVMAVGRTDMIKADYDSNRHYAAIGGLGHPADSGPWAVVDRNDLGPTGCFSDLPATASGSASPPQSPAVSWDLHASAVTCYHGGIEFSVGELWWPTKMRSVTFLRERKTTTFTEPGGAVTYLTGTAIADLVRTIDATLP